MAAQRLLTETGRAEAEVSVLLVDDAAIRVLNRGWRGIDRATDVLSWPQGEGRLDTDSRGARFGDDVLGDVAISLDTALAQSLSRGWSLADEVALLLVHGILHLLGYEDDTDEAAAEMRAIETRIIGRPLEKTDSPRGVQ